MCTLKFDNLDHILIVGKLTNTVDVNSIEIINKFFEGMDLFDPFDGERFFGRELCELMANENYDFLAVYDPINDTVLDFCLSSYFEHWLDSFSAAKQKFGLIAKYRFQKIFATAGVSEHDLFKELIIGS